jgi:hypothetical protein
LRKEIAKVEPRTCDNLLLIFTDGTQQMVYRDEHKGRYSHVEAGLSGHSLTTVHHLKPGDLWPPLEATDAEVPRDQAKE